MYKGIRRVCNAKFLELLPIRAEVGNTSFRKSIMFFLIEEFGCTIDSAATHYNHAFKECKKHNPALVEGLGRSEGKNNGGRKKKLIEFTAKELLKPNMNTDLTPDLDSMQTEFSVRLKSTGEIIADGLSFENARAMVLEAAEQKKDKLYFL